MKRNYIVAVIIRATDSCVVSAYLCCGVPFMELGCVRTTKLLKGPAGSRLRAGPLT